MGRIPPTTTTTTHTPLRKYKNKRWSNISAEVQGASDRKDFRTLYGLLCQVFGPQSVSVAPLESKDGTTRIRDPEGIMQRWKEHFADLFFNPSVVDEEVVDGLPQQDILHHMDCKPTNEEVVLAIN